MTRQRCIIIFYSVCSVSTIYVYLFAVSQSDVHVIWTFRKEDINHTIITYRTLPYTSRRPFYPGVQHYHTANSSKTNPPYYPLNGTGQTVDIETDFDTSLFQQFCKDEKDLEAVIPVYSAPDNFERRKAMRETVGKICTQMRCKMFFIVGVSLNREVYNMVKEEYVAVKDILMINKVDTYRDLNNKVVAMLDFLISYCREPKFVIHIIDDFYPNLPRILEQLHQINKTKFLLSRISRNSGPFRGKSNKWYISPEEYPYSKFPLYLVGVVYAFLNDDSLVLRQTLHAVEYCWIEDVWFTGHVRQGAGFEPLMLRGDYKDRGYASIQEMKNLWRTKAGFHHLIPRQFYEVYNNTDHPL